MSKRLVRSSDPSSYERAFDMWNSIFEAGTWSVPERRAFIHQVEGGSRVEVDAPGLKRSDFKVTVEGDVLSVSAQAPEEVHHRRSFSGSWLISKDVDVSKVTATYTDGVLCIFLPHRPSAQAPTTIEVK